jgi:hypothetical protein
MVALKGKPDIGDQINKKLIAPLANANKLGSGKEMVDRLTNLIAIFENKADEFGVGEYRGENHTQGVALVLIFFPVKMDSRSRDHFAFSFKRLTTRVESDRRLDRHSVSYLCWEVFLSSF